MVDVRQCIDYTSALTDKREQVPPEERILQAIICKAIDDYIICIKKGAIYDVKNISTPNNQVFESCVNIIRSLENNSLFSWYDVNWNYIFRKVDEEYGYWFNYFLGDGWVRPWDFIHDRNFISNN